MKISFEKLILGSAQFDFKYGIKDFNDHTDKKNVINILQMAKNKIKFIDTAPSYENVESLLGNLCKDNFEYYTKTLSINKFDIEFVKLKIMDSIKKLNTNNLYGIFIHNFEDLNNSRFDDFYNFLHDLKKNNLIKKIGFSIYESSEVDHLLKNYDFDIIQLPINIFDQRLKDNKLKLLKKRNVKIIARSIFLQGLLLNLSNYPSYFNKWANSLAALKDYLNKNKISEIDACLSYVNNIESIDNLIIGVKNIQQLNSIFNAKIHNELNFEQFSNEDINLIDPRKWKK